MKSVLSFLNFLVKITLVLALVIFPVQFSPNKSAGQAIAAPGKNQPGGLPDYLGGIYSNWANTPPLRKFVDSIPGVGAANANNLGLYIPLAVPDTTTYPGSEYYQIALNDYTAKMHSDLPPTKLRGYRDLQATGTDALNHYLGPLILARQGTPTRIKFVNQLGTGSTGDLFIPVDTSYMGAGMGPDGMNIYTQNRADLHLHGGDTPWISDGTPHQWVTPANESSTIYTKGVSFQNVPDMVGPGKAIPNPNNKDGEATYYYPNGLSSRLMFYHDHAFGITRLNVYVGEAAGYLLVDSQEDGLINGGVLPNQGGGAYNYGIPLIIQDKTFVDAATLPSTDPTWNWGTTAPVPHSGDLWYPHVYMPNQNPNVLSGANPMGKWDYGPWFWPPLTVAAGLVHGPAIDPVTGQQIPGVPDNSGVMESFQDTPVVNGCAYPYIPVGKKAYRFRILNAANDRSLNLQLYFADTGGGGMGARATATVNAAGAITAINMVNGGTGYNSSTTVNITDLAGTGATATATIAAGVITGVTVTNGGTGYSAAPVITFAGGGPGGSGAQGTATVLNGAVSGIAVGNGGTGYTSPPGVMLIGGGGTGAFASSTINPATGAVTGITVTVPGTGYTSAPSVIIGGDTEVKMIPAVPNTGLPATWPTDGRLGGVPDPATAGPKMIQIGTEGGFLPAPVVLDNTPVGYEYNRKNIVVLDVNRRTLQLLGAERADVIIDFTNVPDGSKIILYNDAPTPMPAFDVRLDYYTGDPDYSFATGDGTGGAPTTLPGYGPNTRTIAQFRVSAALGTDPAPFNLAGLQAALPPVFAATQPVAIVPQSTYPAGTPSNAAVDTYSAIQANSLSFPAATTVGSVTLTSGGTGYTLASPVITLANGGGTGATATATVTNGVITAINITSAGTGYTTPPDVIITGSGTGAVAAATISNGVVSRITVTSGGTGYAADLAVNFTGGGGTGAAATATVVNGVITNITVTNPGAGYTAAPAVAITGAGGTGAIATAVLGLPMQPKAIQELFELDYGRMNTTLGVELPLTNFTIQTTIPYGYIDPATEYVQPNAPQVWKVTHNGVDTHAVHFHLFDVQVINRVGWDGAIRPPDANELGWKDTVRMSPLEDCIVALKPIQPTAPFNIPDSVRPLNPAMPIGSTVGFSGVDPNNNPIAISNQVANFGWEYVWHCHMLDHEEMDMMRPVVFQAPAIPGKPGAVVAAASSAGATVSFQYPLHSLSSPITAYTVTATPGGRTAVGTASPIAVTGLTNGVSYTFTVRATNALGTGQDSDPSNAVTPEAVPPAPTGVSAVAGNGQATVTFTPPTGITSPVISYTVTSNPTSITATGTTSPITVLGLTNGTSYTFTVTADNAFGTSVASIPSNAVTPNVIGAPAAPTGVTAFAGNTRAYVTFTAPPSNGIPFTAFTATSTPGGRTGTALQGPITVNGLTNGTLYTFTVTATNALGTSPASAVSNGVRPATITTPGPATGVVATGGIRQASVRFTAAPANGSPITGYTVTASPGGRTGTGTVSPITVTGLTNGTAYTFTVVARNARGAGPASSPSGSVTLAALPDAPTGVSALAGNTQAQVSFTAPASNGGSAITSYTATSTPGGRTATGATSPLTVTGLTNGTVYTFTVTATNAAGTGPVSLPSNSVTPGGLPGAPTIGAVTAGNAQAIVAFTPPAANGGSPITGYTVTSSGAIPVTATGAASPITVLGLTNGTVYTFTVAAVNSIGTGLPSAASAAVTPATVPNAPTAVTAAAGNGQCVVSFTAPAANGGSPITTYNVISVPGSITATGTASPITVPGLINGNPYTFIVEAVNAIGTSSASKPSNSVTPGGVPGAPTGVTAVANGTSAIVSFVAPVSGGSAITGYTVTSNSVPPIIVTGASSPITVPGLTLGTVYTFTVTATSALGTGPASAPSNSVTPAAVPGAPTGVTALAGNASATVSFTAPAAGGSPITSYTVTSNPGAIIAVGTASPITVPGLTNGTAYTFSVTATNSIGTGLPGVSNSVTPSATVPGAPTSVSATAGNASAVVSFTPPASNGGSAITSYTVTSSGVPAITATGSVIPITVTGLTNGTAYTFTVTATNANGTGGASSPSNSVTPLAVPDAPTAVLAVAGNTTASVSFTPPVSNGGSPIILYTVTSNSVPAISAVGVASPIIVTGLTNGTAYTFTVTATSAVGTGLPSVPSASVTPLVPVVPPGAPTSVIAVPGNAQAAVIFTAPVSNGGAPITSYTVTSSPGSLTASAATLPITVPGLTNGVAYTFTVTAVNSAGTGTASSPSNIVTPAVIPPASGATSMAVGNLDANPVKELIVDFGAGNGIWIYYNNSTWVKLHSISANSITVGNVDGLGGDDIVIDFGPTYGIWVYYNNSSWIQLHNLSAVSMITAKMDATGKDAIVVNFGGTFGVWVYFNPTGWVQLSSVTAVSMAKGNVDGIGTDDLIIDFGPTYGIWVYYNSTTWSQLHVLSALSIITAKLDATGKDAVIVNFGGTNGIWAFTNNSLWTQLHTIAAVSMAKGNIDGAGTDDLIIDFGPTYGIWVYYNNTTWSQLSTSSAKSAVTATLDATGKDAVIVNFGGASGIQGFFNNSAFVNLAA